MGLEALFGQNRWSGRCANRLGVALKPNCRQLQLLHALTQCSNPPRQIFHHDHCSCFCRVSLMSRQAVSAPRFTVLKRSVKPAIGSFDIVVFDHGQRGQEQKSELWI